MDMTKNLTNTTNYFIIDIIKNEKQDIYRNKK